MARRRGRADSIASYQEARPWHSHFPHPLFVFCSRTPAPPPPSPPTPMGPAVQPGSPPEPPIASHPGPPPAEPPRFELRAPSRAKLGSPSAERPPCPLPGRRLRSGDCSKRHRGCFSPGRGRVRRRAMCQVRNAAAATAACSLFAVAVSFDRRDAPPLVPDRSGPLWQLHAHPRRPPPRAECAAASTSAAECARESSSSIHRALATRTNPRHRQCPPTATLWPG